MCSDDTPSDDERKDGPNYIYVVKDGKGYSSPDDVGNPDLATDALSVHGLALADGWHVVPYKDQLMDEDLGPFQTKEEALVAWEADKQRREVNKTVIAFPTDIREADKRRDALVDWTKTMPSPQMAVNEMLVVCGTIIGRSTTDRLILKMTLDAASNYLKQCALQTFEKKGGGEQ